MEIVNIPCDAVMYRGTDLELEKKYTKYISNWYTFSFSHSKAFCKCNYWYNKS